MNLDFIKETVEDEHEPRIVGCLSGWEVIVFELQDEAEDELSALSSWGDRCLRS